MDKRLEDSNIFPIIAWVLIIGFASFVFYITQQLSDAEGYSGDLQTYRNVTVETLEKTP